MGDGLPSAFDESGGDLPDVFASRAKAELEPGERLLWVGHPVFRSEPLGCGLVVSGVLTAGGWVVTLAAAYTASGPEPNASTALAVLTFGAIFSVLVTLGLLGHLHRRAATVRCRSLTSYCLTDRRAVLWAPVPGGKGLAVRSFLRSHVQGVSRIEYPDGTGDVLLAVPIHGGAYLWHVPRGFERVADVRRVEAMARDVFQASSVPALVSVERA